MCKIFGLKIRSCKFLDQSQICIEPKLLKWLHWSNAHTQRIPWPYMLIQWIPLAITWPQLTTSDSFISCCISKCFFYTSNAAAVASERPNLVPFQKILHMSESPATIPIAAKLCNNDNKNNWQVKFNQLRRPSGNLNYNYNGDSGHKSELIISFDFGVLLTQVSMRLLLNLFRDTPLDNIWLAKICVRIDRI